VSAPSGTTLALDPPAVVSKEEPNMRTRSVAALSLLLLTGLLVPATGWAKRVTAGGSLTIAGGSGPLTNQLVAVMVTANPGLEKTIVQQLPLPGPLYVAPFFVNEDKNKPGQGDIGTLVLLTNTTAAPLAITLTLRDLDGNVLGTPAPVNLAAHETRVIELSDLLP
jgi:hypothetical protein